MLIKIITRITVQTDGEETNFASRFAMLRDKFGTSWMLLQEQLLK
jgi:uncharacterized glyoxalase superfamily protein PhnB